MAPIDFSNPPDEQLREILSHSRVLAVVGLSSRPERASHYVATSLQHAGYRIVPVNPALKEILGEQCHPSLTEVGERVDMVIIFRRAEFVPSLVEEAIRLQIGTVWMQVGVQHLPAAWRAMDAGLNVIMDRCAWVDYQRLFGRRL